MSLDLGSLGPPRLFEGGSTDGAAVPLWLLIVLAAMGIVALGLGLRAVRRRMLGDERLAFMLLSRRLKLGAKQRAAVERLATRAGVAPVGLLVCESAFVRAARGERILPATQIEHKPVLLTGAELVELGRVGERLFGPGCLEQGVDELSDRHDQEEADDEASQWVA